MDRTQDSAHDLDEIVMRGCRAQDLSVVYENFGTIHARSQQKRAIAVHILMRTLANKKLKDNKNNRISVRGTTLVIAGDTTSYPRKPSCKSSTINMFTISSVISTPCNVVQRRSGTCVLSAKRYDRAVERAITRTNESFSDRQSRSKMPLPSDQVRRKISICIPRVFRTFLRATTPRGLF